MSEYSLLTPRFEEALQYAAELHRDQRRKASGIPYISHLLSVVALVLQDGGSEDESIAALLHDAVEDQGGKDTLTEIRTRFGEQVGEIVAACSDTDVFPKPPWRARKEAHIERIRNSSPQVHRVMLADKLHNARSLLRDLRLEGDGLWAHFKGGREGTLWYFRAMMEALSDNNDGYMLAELGRVLDEIESLTG